MIIKAISDMHGYLPQISDCDVLLIGGDISPFNIQSDNENMEVWLDEVFGWWIENLPCNKVIMTPGNHDFKLQLYKTHKQRREFEDRFDDKLKCLWNEYYEFEFCGETLKIFGTPYCHEFGKWPFMRSGDILEEKYKEIPGGLDILLTHDPAFMLCNTDVILRPIYQSQADRGHVGNCELKERIMQLVNENQAPKYVLSGHIHSADHEIKEYLGMKVACISVLDERCNKLIYEPLEINI